MFNPHFDISADSMMVIETHRRRHLAYRMPNRVNWSANSEAGSNLSNNTGLPTGQKVQVDAADNSDDSFPKARCHSKAVHERRGVQRLGDSCSRCPEVAHLS
ncbi:hypothetical protein pipiens_012393 [Culex pipiens pipiens]|uniref:Uncharacterized protein n=1 Tax=Culex pipiens pipiens TaxID=38569 RepID=A0ABD1D3S6_CULPP